MRPEHASHGDPCSRCGVAAFRHRNRSTARAEYKAKWEKTREPRKRGYRPQKKHPKHERIITIDGEGQGRGPHLYTYLAAADELTGRTRDVEDLNGLTTRACLEFLISLPRNALIVGYGLSYDLTKMLSDLSDQSLHDLFHEKRRIYLSKGRVQYRPVQYLDFKINFLNKRFTLSRNNKTVVVWDILRFYQSKFTDALIDWKIASREELEAMAEMKELRSKFDQLPFEDVKAYCRDECQKLVKLTRALIQAHIDAGLPLASFYGAGSTATSLLNKFAIKSKRGETPEEMKSAIACAFFGGRFENSASGIVEGEVYDADIASAYPYQTTFLPCLTHGKWEHHHGSRYTRRVAQSSLALIHWRLPKTDLADKSWGPLPVRHVSGTIAFPLAAKGGWTWKEEFEAAKEAFPHVEMLECWTYNTDCDCKPFGDVPRYFLERIKLGGEAKGLVIKLGLNSIYGKLAQSAGLTPPFQQWVWAGNITSGTRALLLKAFLHVKDRSDILMFATDGIKSRVKLTLPKPIDTGTENPHKACLGGWDRKSHPQGIMLVRPGIYFPLNPTDEEMKQVKARGLGKRVLYQQWQAIVDAWKAGQTKHEVTGIARFMGAKSSMTMGTKSGVKRSSRYGEWVPHTIEVSFSPEPKRQAFLGDGDFRLLKAWDYFDFESVPYDGALRSQEAIALEESEQIISEQPDLDFAQMTW